jgi:2-polyprenyl-3-methyl-5-hydroxy-6-metoxy-1,4-benzoquinol methylase
LSNLKNVIEKDTWKNSDMINYYENVPIDVLLKLASIGGIEEGCDVDLAYPYIENTKSLIEAGAAYGRVVKSLIRKGYCGKIYAIERSKNLVNYLKEHYQDKAEIINADIINFEPSEKVDAVLWMWSNIGEFPKKEQLGALKHLATFLNPDGLMILETISHTALPMNLASYDVESQTYIDHFPYGTLCGYTPTIQEIHEYAENLGFSNIQHINYETTTKRPRVLHILSQRKLGA